MPWDFIANIGQQQNIGQGKFYWPSGPYTRQRQCTHTRVACQGSLKPSQRVDFIS